jgi:hypothetical protein
MSYSSGIFNLNTSLPRNSNLNSNWRCKLKLKREIKRKRKEVPNWASVLLSGPPGKSTRAAHTSSLCCSPTSGVSTSVPHCVLWIRVCTLWCHCRQRPTRQCPLMRARSPIDRDSLNHGPRTSGRWASLFFSLNRATSMRTTMEESGAVATRATSILR